MCVDFVVNRLTDGSELHDGVAAFERLECLVKAGQIGVDKHEAWIVAELRVSFRNIVDADDDVAPLEGFQDDALADAAVTSSHCDLHLVSGGDQYQKDPMAYSPRLKSAMDTHGVPGCTLESAFSGIA